MSPLDLMGWALGAIAAVLAMACAGVTTVLFTRLMEEQRANLAAHRAVKAQEIAEARAAEQRAELEAADVLERRLALPLGGGTTSRGEQLESRLDDAAAVIRQMQENQRAFARELTMLSGQLAAVRREER